MSSTYYEKFPRCDGCPNLASMQAVRDKTARELEEISIDAGMENAEIDFYVEMLDIKYESLINEHLENGAMETDASVMELRAELARLKATVADAMDYVRSTEEFIEAESNSLLNEIDDRAEWVVVNCPDGAKRLAKLGILATSCGTTVKPSDMPPLSRE